MLFFCPVKLALRAPVDPPPLVKISRVIPRASGETPVRASSGPSAAAAVTAAEAADRTAVADGRIVVAVHPVARGSNAVAPAARGITAAIKAAIPGPRAVRSSFLKC